MGEVTRWLAFLRGINIGNRRVRMEALRTAFDELGLSDVATFIASGNVVFASQETREVLRPAIEAHLEKALGFPVPVYLRTPSELRRLAARRPFGDVPEKNVQVAFLHAPLSAAAKRALAALPTADSPVAASGAHLLWHTPGGVSGSAVAWPAVETAIGQASTLRGLTTVRKMVERFCG